MRMSMGPSLHQALRQELVVNLPPTNWSLLDTFKKEGDKPLRFAKRQLDLSNLSLEERLAKVDSANEVFRFHYVRREGTDDKGEPVTEYYKIPLMRDSNVFPDDIKVKIKKSDYDRAKTILSGSGGFQRIARAVPYSQLYRDVVDFVKEKGCSLDDVVVIGVDRGGRLPSFIMREALGKQESHTLKVDQSGGGTSGDVDINKLNELIQKGYLKGKMVLFVDSTVDSGRQINVLSRYFDNPDWQAKIGHKAWGVVGSNENGTNHYNHKNINWGLDPDESFEDNPELMGVDYAPGSSRKVVDCPNPTSEAIKSALLEVPKGVVLDFSNLSKLLRIKRAYLHIERALKSKAWKDADDTKRDLGVSGLEVQATVPESTQKKKLLVIGNGSTQDLSEEEASYIAGSLASYYDVIAGTPNGNPGKVLDTFNRVRKGSSQLYQPAYLSGDKEEVFGRSISFTGDSKEDFRENLVQNADAVLVLGGNEGTLRETILSVHAGKPVYVVEGYGAVGNYASKAELKHKSEFHLVKSLPEAVKGLKENR